MHKGNFLKTIILSQMLTVAPPELVGIQESFFGFKKIPLFF